MTSTCEFKPIEKAVPGRQAILTSSVSAGLVVKPSQTDRCKHAPCEATQAAALGAITNFKTQQHVVLALAVDYVLDHANGYLIRYHGYPFRYRRR
jgi:hypothetical protein